MRKEDVDIELSGLAFDFFYWFSRFEFALKENNYLKSHKPGAKAEPGWDEFVKAWGTKYTPSIDTSVLLTSPPERQIVLSNKTPGWEPVELADCQTELEKVVRLVKTVRNNLFHGGKHGALGWDNQQRARLLLTASKQVLDQLAKLASIEADYTRYY